MALVFMVDFLDASKAFDGVILFDKLLQYNLSPVITRALSTLSRVSVYPGIINQSDC